MHSGCNKCVTREVRCKTLRNDEFSRTEMTPCEISVPEHCALKHSVGTAICHLPLTTTSLVKVTSMEELRPSLMLLSAEKDVGVLVRPLK